MYIPILPTGVLENAKTASNLVSYYLCTELKVQNHAKVISQKIDCTMAFCRKVSSMFLTGRYELQWNRKAREKKSISVGFNDAANEIDDILLFKKLQNAGNDNLTN